MLRRMFIVVVIVCFASVSWAEDVGVSFSPVALALVGVFAINTGVAMANGLSIAVDNPNRTNGRFGLYSGVATAALGGALYLVSLGDEEGGQGALVFAGAGVASAAMGAWTIWAAEKKDGEVRLSSSVLPRIGGASVMMSIDF